MAKLSSDGKYVTVEKNDTLYAIARDYGNGKTYQELAKLNNIQNPDLIYVGQTIKLDGTADDTKASTTSQVTITAFGLQVNTDRTVFATWTWTKDNTDHYECKWYYATGNGVWFVGSESDDKNTQSVYNAPSNATKVKFKAKPVSKTHKVNGKDTSYWTGSWSTEKTYEFSSNPPQTPAVPSVTIKDDTLTCEIDNLDVKNINAKQIQFEIVKDNYKVFKSANITIKSGFNYVRYTCTVDSGSEYKARARSVRDKLYSNWSDYCNPVSTVPSVPTKINKYKARSETSVYLEWTKVDSAETYNIQYATKEEYFNGSNLAQEHTGIETNSYELGGLETGEKYYFRVCAVNDAGKSGYSEAVSITIGSPPEAPTTWSSTSTLIQGEPITVYWVHNSKDGSNQQGAQLNCYDQDYVDKEDMENPDESTDLYGVTYTFDTPTTEEDDEDVDIIHSDTEHISEYIQSRATDGDTVYWKIRTKGITGEWSEWSIRRSIKVYSQPTLDFSVTNAEGEAFLELSSFPMRIYALPGPKTQAPISYHITIKANEGYETIDDIGNVKMVAAGETVFSRYYDIRTALDIELSAYDVDLENNVEYTLTCSVTMNSGLTAMAETSFTVAWTDLAYEPNAEIGIDYDTLVAYIQPYCVSETNEPIKNVRLSVYRRQYDGGFIEIAKNIVNDKNTFIIDPHPALDYARYRIVAVSEDTGSVSYYDVPGYPVRESSIIIQWDDSWSTFDATDEGILVSPPWSGSLLRLPYNVDVNESPRKDVSLIEYIGREHPVSYYGTQRGEAATWKTEIDKADKETVYTLRRLAVWSGNAYVREPSGIGYWANVSVSMDQQHCAVTIPVTLSITRVEGGA